MTLPIAGETNWHTNLLAHINTEHELNGQHKTGNALVKGWAVFPGTATSGAVTAGASYNVASIVSGGTGYFTITWTNAFSSANYCVSALATISVTGNYAVTIRVVSLATTHCVIECRVPGGYATTVTAIYLMAIGTLA